MTVRRADTFGVRLRGLALRRSAGDALYFPRCRSVHTIGMRFALDLIWVDADGAIVRIDRGVAPLARALVPRGVRGDRVRGGPGRHTAGYP